MKLALRELIRRPGRFVTATVILTLIAVLLMFLGGLLDGLIRSSTGAIRAQDADVIVYAESAQASFLRSRIDPDLRATVEAVPGVTETGGIGIVQLGARVPGNGPRDALIPPGSIPLDVGAGRIATSVVLLLVAAVIGCAFSLRRVLKVDPASAIGSSS